MSNYSHGIKQTILAGSIFLICAHAYAIDLVVIEGSQYGGIIGSINGTTTAVTSGTAAITAAINGQTATNRATMEKVATTINNNNEINRQKDLDQKVVDEHQKIVDEFKLPPSPCTTANVGSVSRSVRNYAHSGGMGSSSSRGSADGGYAGGVSNEFKIDQGAVSRFAQSKNIDRKLLEGAPGQNTSSITHAASDSQIHFQDFCTDEDMKIPSRRTLCSSTRSKFPNGDISMKSFVDGPGYARDVEGAVKSSTDMPEVHNTITEMEKVPMALFIKGLDRSQDYVTSLPADLAKSPMALAYYQKLNEYSRQVSIATAPYKQSMEERSSSVAVAPLIQSMQAAQAAGPGGATGDAATQYGSSAYTYFQKWKASRDRYLKQEGALSKEYNTMSAKDLLAFDVNRRYLNGDWYVEVSGMEAASPIEKEQAYMTAQTNYLLMRLTDRVEMSNYLLGALLGNNAQGTYGPELSALYAKITGQKISTNTAVPQ